MFKSSWYNDGFSFNRRTTSRKSLDGLTLGVRLVVRRLTDGLLTTLDSSLTVLKAFAYLFLCLSGLEKSRHNLISLLGEIVKFCPFIFAPDFAFF